MLDRWLGADRAARVRDAIAKHGEAIAVTALVVLLLEREAAERAGEWKAAITKAKRWLARHAGSFDAGPLVAS